MLRLAPFVLLAWICTTPALAVDDARETAVTSRVVLKVVHPDEVRRAILDAVEPRGGFPVLVTDEQLVLKVPPPRLGEVLALLSEHGLLIEKTLAREDLTQRVAQLEAQLRSKREIFQRLRTLVDDSDVQATLEIERNMAGLVREMESIKGQLRVQRERARWARVEVAFNFRDRQKLVYVRSPFEWLNTVDLKRFHREFFDE